MCKQQEETFTHLFIGYSKAISFWNRLVRELCFDTNLTDNLIYINNYKNHNERGGLFTSLAKIVMWELRNTLEEHRNTRHPKKVSG